MALARRSGRRPSELLEVPDVGWLRYLWDMFLETVAMMTTADDAKELGMIFPTKSVEV